MNIPKSVLNKIENLRNIRNEANSIELDIMKWFEDNGIDTGDNSFADDIGSKIAYGEFTNANEINDLFQEYLNGRRK